MKKLVQLVPVEMQKGKHLIYIIPFYRQFPMFGKLTIPSKDGKKCSI